MAKKKVTPRRARAAALPRTLSRRAVLVSAGAASIASLASFRMAHGMEGEGMPGAGMPAVVAKGAQPEGAGMPDAPPTGSASRRYQKDSDQANVRRRYPHVHEGKGAIDVKFFFREEQASKPALFLIYTIPPGASEGVHVHKPGDAKLGSFDEFYYIVSGSGEMEIDGEKVSVRAGDHVLTPNGVPHGIENTSSEGDLKVYLLAMIRD